MNQRFRLAVTTIAAVAVGLAAGLLPPAALARAVPAVPADGASAPAPVAAPASRPAADTGPASAARPAVSAAPAVPAAPLVPAALDDESSCSDLDPATGKPLSTRLIGPSSILRCHTAAVTLTVRASCEAAPLHVMLSIDRSGSMIGQGIRDAKTAANALIDALDMRESPNVKIGLVSHGPRPTRDLKLTNNATQARGRIGSLNAGGEDNLADSISMAHSELRDGRDDVVGQPVEVMVVLSDGGQTRPPDSAIPPANQAKSDGILVVAVCIENGTAGGCTAMRRVASSSRYYFESQGTGGLKRIFQQIAKDVKEIKLRSLVIEETLPENLFLLQESVWPDAEWDETNRKLRWDFAFAPTDGISMGYHVAPLAVQTYTVAAANLVSFRDSRNNLGSFVMPTAVLTVPDECPGVVVVTPTPTDTPTPTPTDTPTPTPTNTPSHTPTHTPTPTDTPTPTATPTPRPRPIYLPILNLSRCVDLDRPVDAVLVIDASTSMRTATLSGSTRIAAAQDGARRFVDLMRPVDQAAVVAFNSAAHTLVPLTGDRAALKTGIDGIDLASWTRIDLALDAATAVLTGPAARPGSRRAIVLLTDGLPTQTTPDAVRAAGAAARAVATVFVIGVGDEVDRALMADVAGDVARFIGVDDADGLAHVYAQIAEKIACDGP